MSPYHTSSCLILAILWTNTTSEEKVVEYFEFNHDGPERGPFLSERDEISLLRCSITCTQIDACVAFLYNPKTRLCQLSDYHEYLDVCRKPGNIYKRNSKVYTYVKVDKTYLTCCAELGYIKNFQDQEWKIYLGEPYLVPVMVYCVHDKTEGTFKDYITVKDTSYICDVSFSTGCNVSIPKLYQISKVRIDPVTLEVDLHDERFMRSVPAEHCKRQHVEHFRIDLSETEWTFNNSRGVAKYSSDDQVGSYTCSNTCGKCLPPSTTLKLKVMGSG